MKAAIYCRLSKEDEYKIGESESIQNQKSMLIQYAIEKGFDIYQIYSDEDYSGIDRNRPAFNSMIQAASEHKFDVVLAKTQSRFTRDMELVEKYLHGKFIEWGIRFIAVVDHVDTNDTANKKSRQINGLINEWYLEDLSTNVRSVLDHKRKEGLFIGSFARYGYCKDPNAKGKLIIDPEAAEVVRRIFSMALSGIGAHKIARILNDEKVPSPTAYKQQHGIHYHIAAKNPNADLWSSPTVYQMLHNQLYVGDMVQGRHKKVSYKSEKTIWLPQSQWIVVENTHEAIIDQETFDLAQKVRSKVRRYPDGWGDVAPLTGLLYCADCGGKMYVHRFNNGKRISQYTCSKYSKIPVGTLCKTQHRINESVVLELVKDLLKAIAEYAKHERAEFVRVVQEAQSSQQTAEVKKQRTRLATAKQRISELEVLLCKIYEDNILGKLSDSRYATLDAQYEKEQKELTAEISTLEKAISDYEKHEKDADRFIALIDKYENFDELTITMLNEFVEKILVHERDRKGSIQTTQEVEIYFNFVGRFVPPKFAEVELTPEELEEIRKREERKDRLHQNYLKRKASGWQRQYEDRTKAKKKAEMDAKKNALRAEDIAKGVFIPVSNMPKLEPKMAPQKGA